MKACVTTGEKRRVEYREVPMPSLEPGMLLLKTIYFTICGSDLEMLDGRVGRDLSPGTILGHEFVAEVVEVGEGVIGWAVGDRAVWLAGHSSDAEANRQRPPFVSGRGYSGCWAEYFVVQALEMQKVPDHVSNEEAAFVEPLITGMGSVEASGLKPGQSGVIIGVGKIGLLAVMSAKLVGAAPVIAIDILQPHLDKALELGADAAINANEVDVISEVAKLTEGGPHAVIICARHAKVLNQALEMSSRGSTIVLAGFVAPTEVSPADWTTKQLRIVTVLGARAGQLVNMCALSLYLIAHKQIDPRPLISEIMPMEDIQRAIDSRYSGENIAVLVKP